MAFESQYTMCILVSFRWFRLHARQIRFYWILVTRIWYATQSTEYTLSKIQATHWVS